MAASMIVKCPNMTAAIIPCCREGTLNRTSLWVGIYLHWPAGFCRKEWEKRKETLCDCRCTCSPTEVSHRSQPWCIHLLPPPGFHGKPSHLAIYMQPWLNVNANHFEWASVLHVSEPVCAYLETIGCFMWLNGMIALPMRLIQDCVSAGRTWVYWADWLIIHGVTNFNLLAQAKARLASHPVQLKELLHLIRRELWVNSP